MYCATKLFSRAECFGETKNGLMKRVIAHQVDRYYAYYSDMRRSKVAASAPSEEPPSAARSALPLARLKRASGRKRFGTTPNARLSHTSSGGLTPAESEDSDDAESDAQATALGASTSDAVASGSGCEIDGRIPFFLSPRHSYAHGHTHTCGRERHRLRGKRGASRA